MYWLFVIIIIIYIIFMDIEVLIFADNNINVIQVVIFRFIRFNIHLDDEAKHKAAEKIDLEGLRNYKNIFKGLLPHVRKFIKTVTLKYSLQISFGLNSCDDTAILFGILNWLSSIVFSISNIYFRDCSCYTNFNPNFNNKEFNYRVSLYLHFRLSNIIGLMSSIRPLISQFKKENKKRINVKDYNVVKK